MQITGVKNIKYGTVKTLQDGYDKVECAPNLDIIVSSTVAVFELCSGTITSQGPANQIIFLENCPLLRIKNPDGRPTFRNGIPVGGYFKTDSNVNPASVFGGYWAKELSAGRGLVSAGTGFAVGTEGGELTHTLTLAEMPAHTHDLPLAVAGIDADGDIPQRGYSTGLINKTVGSTGSSQAHNNMPPYHATNIWKRIVDPAGTGLE